MDPKASPTTAALSEAARENGVWLLGGSYPEVDPNNGRVYNTSVVFDPRGEIVATHRKVHLFDIDIPGGQYFKESDTLSGGAQMTTFDTPWCRMGLAICYDVRFPELSMLMRDAGCDVLLFPAAFNVTTGPLHWELLLRARAVDNQVYVAAISPARSEDSNAYQAWGHSSIIDPWGKVAAGGDAVAEGSGTIVSEIDLDAIASIRQSIPVSHQKRHDVYTKVAKA
jgi:omega-amidase